MNKTQKASIFALVIYLFAALLISCAFTTMFMLNRLPVFAAYLSLIAVFAMPVIAFFFMRKKQSPAEPDSDERDKIIKQKAVLAAFVSVWILLIASNTIQRFFVGEAGSVPVDLLSIIHIGVFLGSMIIYSIAVLIQYSRAGKGEKS